MGGWAARRRTFGAVHVRGGREGGGLRALNKVVNSLDRETLMLILTLILTLRRALVSLAELSWSWSDLGAGWISSCCTLELDCRRVRLGLPDFE